MERSSMAKLYELRDEIECSLSNAQSVLDSQTELIEIVRNAKDTRNNFEDFISGCEESLEGILTKIENWSHRLTLVKSLIARYECGKRANASDSDKEMTTFVNDIITDLMIALSIDEEPTEPDEN